LPHVKSEPAIMPSMFNLFINCFRRFLTNGVRHRETILKRRRELHSSNSKEARAEAKFSKDLCKALKKALPVSDGDESMSESDNDSNHSSDDENNPYVLAINRYKMKHDLNVLQM
jgi:hypothetical protein